MLGQPHGSFIGSKSFLGLTNVCCCYPTPFSLGTPDLPFPLRHHRACAVEPLLSLCNSNCSFYQPGIQHPGAYAGD